MPSITVNFPVSESTRIVDALSTYGGYRTTLEDADGNPVANPVTRATFAREVVIGMIRDVVRSHERAESRKTADAVTVPDIT